MSDPDRPSRKPRGEANRQRILDLAVAAIDTGGEASIRVNDLAADAGVTTPVLYYHFGDRDGLVIAAQVARYSRRILADIEGVTIALAACTSRQEVRDTLESIWLRTIAGRADSRWVRMNVVGSAYARPDLERAISIAQEDLIDGIVDALEPVRERGWLRPGLDVRTAVAWQHGVLLGRAFVERDGSAVDLDEWDRITLAAFVDLFCGPDPGSSSQGTD